jgi:hypothetical protein
VNANAHPKHSKLPDCEHEGGAYYLMMGVSVDIPNAVKMKKQQEDIQGMCLQTAAGETRVR